MNIKLIDPQSGLELRGNGEELRTEEGVLHRKVNGIYRFVAGGNYTDNFGFQWNKFDRTQIDTLTGVSQSRVRFFAETRWDKVDLRGQNVLEVGSGAGRFTQVLLDHTAATVYSVDYSAAVEANFRNNGHHGDRLNLFQASIYELPFAPFSFDRVFCFGVLQHTPDVRRSVECLARMVKPGGELVVDFYPIRGWWTKIHIKYALRPFTRRMSHQRLLRLINANVDWLLALAKLSRKLGVGKLASRFIPLSSIATQPPDLSDDLLRERTILDTFDAFSPEFDQPQRIATVAKWFRECGLTVTQAEYVRTDGRNEAPVVRGVRPNGTGT